MSASSGWTGDRRLDDIIHQYRQGFLTTDFAQWQDYAAGSCSEITNKFVKLLRSQGLNATTSEEFDVSNPLDRFDKHSAELFGYDDRTMGEWSSHATALVATDRGLFSVDWTAAQYGYHDLPLVQRLSNAEEILAADGAPPWPQWQRCPATAQSAIQPGQAFTHTFNTPNDEQLEINFNEATTHIHQQVVDLLNKGRDANEVRAMAREVLIDEQAVEEFWGYGAEEAVDNMLDEWFQNAPANN